ncbi:hypothetical protein K461DRAFT_292874 [Myriangium duriaei CBS 260.36]|uniref:Uncharacterized protein n=1 Tax=Myriangium duriaei CBS 260.36 TaxID=1168546 RepID=A0A9P4J3Q9_9PEZI|nr:hypothetical protein K461DRAFT_292874 [Myriangium duriaei CBS 260.36]
MILSSPKSPEEQCQAVEWMDSESDESDESDDSDHDNAARRRLDPAMLEGLAPFRVSQCEEVEAPVVEESEKTGAQEGVANESGRETQVGEASIDELEEGEAHESEVSDDELEEGEIREGYQRRIVSYA